MMLLCDYDVVMWLWCCYVTMMLLC